MKPLSMIFLIVCTLSVIAVPVISNAADQPAREVAITIDDLPAGSANTMSAATITRMTTKLLTTLRDQKIPVVGFVNERKLYKFGEVDEAHQGPPMWLTTLRAGQSHLSHSSLNQVGLQAWKMTRCRRERHKTAARRT